jgi:hypothetical protein
MQGGNNTTERGEARLNKKKRHASESGPTAAALSTAAVKATAASKPRAEEVAGKKRAAVKSQHPDPYWSRIQNQTCIKVQYSRYLCFVVCVKKCHFFGKKTAVIYLNANLLQRI